MNCRDCLHFKACYEMATANNADEFNTMFAEKCEDFTDRSEWVHLPCKVGDTVYYFDGAYYLKDKSRWKIKPIKVTEISTKIGRSGKLYPLSIIANGTRYSLTSIGEKLFLTREEAVKALERKKRNEWKG